jgi:signal transduction histidine kinase
VSEAEMNVEPVRDRLATVLPGFTNISRENGPYGSSMTRILLTPGQAAALADRLERAEDHVKAERKAGAVEALREVQAEWRATITDLQPETLKERLIFPTWRAVLVSVVESLERHIARLEASRER